VNAQNKLGDTALHNAAWKGHVEIVEMLLEKGFFKIQNVWIHVCTIITTVGCKLDLLNNEKQTPFDLAAKSPECGRLLMPHNSNFPNMMSL